jgi:hypothetical protein
VRRPAVLREGDGGVVGAGPPGGAEEMGSGARPPSDTKVEETGRCCDVASGRAGVEGGAPRPAVSSGGGPSTASRSEWKTRRWDRAVAAHVEEAGRGRGREHRGGGRAVVGEQGRRPSERALSRAHQRSGRGQRCSEHGLICHLFELILVIHCNTSNGTNHIV